jgi:2-polyprenyl-3-methyl-5-hydroxy-6-metoxy-1,4-benzoquinol methylase
MKTYRVLKDIVFKTDADTGVPILTSQPLDDIDTLCLEYLIEQKQQGKTLHCLDIGGGAGKHAIRVAQTGHTATLIDRDDPSHYIKQVADADIIKADQITLVQKQFNAIDVAKDLAAYDLIYSQRALNYMPYDEFMAFMRNLTTHLPIGGRFYISVSGYDNEFGRSFPLRDKSLPERYGYVTDAMKIKHNIQDKTLVIKCEELTDIMKGLGYKILYTNVTTFGNVKLIGEKI